LEREEKRKKLNEYENRSVEVQEEVIRESLHEIEVKRTIEKLQYGCPACWMNCKEDIYHEVESCGLWEFTGMEHEGFKGGVKYEKDVACRSCSLPCDWCEDYVEGGARGCRKKDLVMPIVMRCRGSELGRTTISKVAGREFKREKEYREWLSTPCEVFGRKSMNAFWLFTEICRVCM